MAPLSKDAAEELRALHYRAVRAAQQYEAATPGTRTKATKEKAWDRAEGEFSKRLDFYASHD